MITSSGHPETFMPRSIPAVVRSPGPWLGGGSIVLFTILLIDAMVRPRAFFDLHLMQVIQGIDAPGLPTFVQRINVLTSTTGAIAAWSLALIVLVLARWWLPALSMAMLPAGGVVNEGIGQVLVSRSRPHLPELARSSGNFEDRSFPSGHVTGAVLLYGLLFVIAGRIRHPWLRRLVRFAVLIPLVSVGFARVWSGAHWPTDVFGAYALGAILLVGLVALHHRVDAAVGTGPLFPALARDHVRPHAHALTNLIRFEHTTATKLHAPGFLPRMITRRPVQTLDGLRHNAGESESSDTSPQSGGTAGGGGPART